jgi:predicted alpha/beta-hydrolase family hydrolase
VTDRRFLIDGPREAPATLLLAHGAGAAMDAAAMTAITAALAAAGLRVARFEFAYMAARREGTRKPPPRAETLMPEYRAAVADLGAAIAGTGAAVPLLIGGKSMGGRVASMVADDLLAAGAIAGLVVIGYPFHPPGRPEAPRIGHLASLATPALICQGTRDPFGTREDVAAYELSGAIRIVWLEDGDHDLKPRKGLSGFSATDHLARMAAEVAAFAASR